MTELSVLSVKRRTKNVDLVNKTESLKTRVCPWKVLEKSLNFVCLKLYEPCFYIFEFWYKITRGFLPSLVLKLEVGVGRVFICRWRNMIFLDEVSIINLLVKS